MKQYFLDLIKNYVGPILVAAVLIYGYTAYQERQALESTVLMQQEALVELRTQTTELSATLTGHCKELLESQGFVISTELEEK